MTIDLERRRDAAAWVVADAAEAALGCFRRRADLEVLSKKPQDFVSQADRSVEAMVRRHLGELFPGEPVVGEEEGGETADAYWIVDPIDGTSNFLAGSPLWGVSLGYVVHDVPVVGAVAAPVLGERMAAADGTGMLLNGTPFRRQAPAADLRLVSMGDTLGENIDDALALHRTLRNSGWVVEAFHSTSVSMLFAASGRLDGHIQPLTTMWDLAGGAALCREAGLTVEIQRHPDGAYGVWAGTPALMAAIGRG